MDRLKLWLFALLVIGAAGLSLFAVTGDLGARAVQLLDARLVAASARVTASQRALQGDAGAVAALAARDPALIHALADDGSSRGRRVRTPGDAAQESAAQQVARAAVAAAEAELGVSLPQGARFTAAQRSWLEARAEDPAADAATVGFLRDALGGKPRRGFLRAGGGLAWGVATPAGAGVLGVFVPVDAAWVASVASGSGVDLTIAAPGLAPVSSLRAGAEPLVKAALAGPGAVRDAGRLAPVAVDVGGVRLGNRRLLLASPPAHRVMALPLADVKDGAAVLSVATQPLLAPVVELQWRGLAGLALAAVLALLFGLLVRSGAPAAARPAAPAPGFAPPPQEAAPEPSWVPSRPATPPPVPLAPAAPVIAEPVPPPPEAAFAAVEPAPPLPSVEPAPTLRLEGAALGRAPDAAAATAPFRAAPAAVEPAPSPAEPPQGAAAPAVPAGEATEEEHWREVFREFLRVRAECGESTQGLTYERLRGKLESNRAALMAKYGCRTVRFQVYVKEGKTALKATPVR